MANSYKSLKEDFVSNLTGGEISEINYVTAVAPAAIVLWSILQSRQAFFVAYNPLSFAVDFLLNVGAILLSVTLYSSMPLLLNVLLISPALGLYAVPAATSTRNKFTKPLGKVSSQNNQSMEPLAMKPFLTTYRGCMMVITCLAILAVDFRIFPRRFAKVENWGTSLMDLGVGSFVFSAGVVAARSVLKEQAAGQSIPLIKRLYASGRHSLPLIVLGLIRLYSVKGLDYAEHVTEYGVHWNFFFTLAFLPPFVAVFHAVFRLVPSYAVLAILLGVIYQAVLEFTDLKAFILTASRVDLFSKNREGIFSFFGYLSIFLTGQATGMYILPRFIIPGGPSAGGSAQRKRLLLTLITWSGVWIVLYNITSNYKFGLGLSVSRRLANLPYVLWVSAFNCVQLTAFCAIETVLFPGFYKATDSKSEKEHYKHATSRVLAAYNRNGLAIFLVANLLTGLVNLTIPTLNATDIQAMGILLCYAAVVTGFAVVLDLYNISIKL